MSNHELSNSSEQMAGAAPEGYGEASLAYEAENLSRLAQIKKTGGDLIKIVLTADRRDIARSITGGF